MERTDAHRLAEAELPQVVDLQLLLRAVDLVGDEHKRRSFSQQQAGNRHVILGQRRSGIGHEDDDVGAADGDLGLLADAGRELLVGAELPAPCVDEEELPAYPLGFELPPVACDTRLLVDNGSLSLEDPVDQGRLAHIGPSEHCNDGKPAHARAPARTPAAVASTGTTGAPTPIATSSRGMLSRNTSPCSATSGTR